MRLAVALVGWIAVSPLAALALAHLLRCREEARDYRGAALQTRASEIDGPDVATAVPPRCLGPRRGPSPRVRVVTRVLPALPASGGGPVQHAGLTSGTGCPVADESQVARTGSHGPDADREDVTTGGLLAL